MAKKKAAKKAAPAEEAISAVNPAMMNPMAGMMPQGGGQMNPMMQMAQIMQMMLSGGAASGMIDPSAVPFNAGQVVDDGDQGLNEDFVRPALLQDLIKQQEAVTLGCVLDQLCLSEDGNSSLGGVPKGCTIAFAGPPGKGKTR
ncbi:MAG: hypothetical protein KDA96_28870, partial [Planctomycetaceae bacterium]|nr:hypothetical protein [Planctomycetaceae bacterium]